MDQDDSERKSFISRIGTLGILRQAKKVGMIELLSPLVEQLQQNGIYMQQRLVNAVLRDVGELETNTP